MFTLQVENKYGQRLELTHNEAYVITSIDGIDPPDAVINTTRNASADGSVFNSSYVDNRVIIITLSLNAPAEENRINLYKYFKAKYPVRLYYKNESRDVYIDGYVRNINVDMFAQKQVAQITIFCPLPFFKSKDSTMIDFSSVEPLFEFPFEIESEIPFSEIIAETEKNIINNGDVETGAVFTLSARGALTNPIIYNSLTNEYFKLNIGMVRGDEIIISTVKNNKSVVKISAGVKTNIVGNIAYGSTWFQFVPTDNLFVITAQTNPENLEAYVIINDQFEGV